MASPAVSQGWHPGAANQPCGVGLRVGELNALVLHWLVPLHGIHPCYLECTRCDLVTSVEPLGGSKKKVNAFLVIKQPS